jgi:glycosyltransferase involved in cell wall biosynthesis
MRIEIFAICYNEEALLPYFLRHYSSFADRIVVYDNYSTDRSVEICRANPLVEVIKYGSGDRIRDDIYLQIKNNCWKGSPADWVIICDIDELVYHPNIRELLAGCDATLVEPDLFNMFTESFPTTDGQIYDEVVMGIAGGGKKNLFKPRDIVEINYDPGCHVAYPAGRVFFSGSLGIKTLHMKFLGLDYSLARKRLSESRLSELNKTMGWGVHYRVTDDEMIRTFNEDITKAIKVL